MNDIDAPCIDGGTHLYRLISSTGIEECINCGNQIHIRLPKYASKKK